MSNKERTDAKKNKAKIVKKLIKEPLSTQREIAKDIGIGKTTVQEHLKELKTTKDDRIIGICDDDLKIVKLGQLELLKRLKKNPDKIGVRDIVSAMESGTKRYTIFKGDVTDKEGGLKSIEGIEIIVG